MRRSERLVRGLAAACLTTGVALAMHVAGGGQMPSAAGVAVPGALALAVSVNLAGVPLSRWRLTAASIASQAVFHVAFSWGAGGATVTMQAAGGHAAHGPHALALDAGSGIAPHHLHLTPSMIAAHALAAFGTYAVLRRADVLLDFARRWALDLASRLMAPQQTCQVPTARAVPPSRSTPLRTRIVACAHGLRGPPLSLA